MRISTFIAVLEKLQNEHGDLFVEHFPSGLVITELDVEVTVEDGTQVVQIGAR